MAQEQEIKWYRSPIDRKVMSELIRQSNYQGFKQVLLQLGLSVFTGALAYWVSGLISMKTWQWSVPVFLGCLLVHGTFYAFFGGAGPIHELSHKTVFKSKKWNEFFLKVYSFLSFHNWVGFRASHVRHHQVTIHEDLDGEVVLPFHIKPISWLWSVVPHPVNIWNVWKMFWSHARGIYVSDWEKKILGGAKAETRLQHRNWARFVLVGHIGLAALFVGTGQWPLVVLVSLAPFYGGWLAGLCVYPQHAGLMPNSNDFRLCCRTYTCSRPIGFLYWNMQYHIEHHMYPAVPFYNLPKLRKAIEFDLPAAPHGLVAAWKELLPHVNRQKTEPKYFYVPEVSRKGTEEPVSMEEADVLG
ncbi:MAG: fatty acid desaturase [Verrucomicrobiota bacterium]|mgnify:CR=1 FL=1|nr:fatty acid desaturase [Verrucomicrobiota bacterium]